MGPPIQTWLMVCLDCLEAGTVGRFNHQGVAVPLSHQSLHLLFLLSTESCLVLVTSHLSRAEKRFVPFLISRDLSLQQVYFI